MPKPLSIRRLMTGTPGKVTGTAVLATALLATLVTPAAADDSGYYPNPKPCQPGARFAVGWDNANDHVFGRDCESDGIGIRVVAYADDSLYGNGYIEVGEVWDHSSDGNGTWNPPERSAHSGDPVFLDVIGTKNGNPAGNLLVPPIFRDYRY